MISEDRFEYDTSTLINNNTIKNIYANQKSKVVKRQLAYIPHMSEMAYVVDSYTFKGKTYDANSDEKCFIIEAKFRNKTLPFRGLMIDVHDKFINPFILFINGIHIKWSKIEVIHDYHYTFILVSMNIEVNRLHTICLPSNTEYTEVRKFGNSSNAFLCFSNEGTYKNDGPVQYYINDNITKQEYETDYIFTYQPKENIIDKENLLIFDRKTMLLYTEDSYIISLGNTFMFYTENGKFDAKIIVFHKNFNDANSIYSLNSINIEDEDFIKNVLSQKVTFKQYGDINVARTGIMCSNGKECSLICGGNTSINAFKNIIEKLSIDGKVSISDSNLLQERTRGNTFIDYNNSVYIANGINAHGIIKNIECIDSNNVISTTSVMLSTAREGAACMNMVNPNVGAVIIAGGNTNTGYTNTAEMAITNKSGKYEAFKTMPILLNNKIYGASGILLLDRGGALVIGGVTESNVFMNTVELFNGDSWMIRDAAIEKRACHNIFSSDNILYGGGKNESGYLKSCECMTEDAAKANSDLLVNRANMGSWTNQNIIIGGENESSILMNMEKAYIYATNDDVVNILTLLDDLSLPEEINDEYLMTHIINIIDYNPLLLNDLFVNDSIYEFKYSGSELKSKSKNGYFNISPKDKDVNSAIVVFVNGELFKYYEDILYIHNRYTIPINSINDTDEIVIMFFKKYDNDFIYHTSANITTIPEGIRKRDDLIFLSDKPILEDQYSKEINISDPSYYYTPLKPVYDDSNLINGYELSYIDMDDIVADTFIPITNEKFKESNFTIVSERQFRSMHFIVNESIGIGIKLPEKFKYCKDPNRYMVFINYRKISINDFLITDPGYGKPFYDMRIYFNILTEPGDRIDILYMPEPFAECGAYGDIDANNNIVSIKDNLLYQMNTSSCKIFINGKYIPNDYIENISSFRLKILKDIGTIHNFSIIQNYNKNFDSIYDIFNKAYVNNKKGVSFYASKWDSFVFLYKEIQNQLFNFENIKISDNEIDIKRNQVPMKSIAYEILKEFHLKNPINIDKFIEYGLPLKRTGIDSHYKTTGLMDGSLIDKIAPYADGGKLLIDKNSSHLLINKANSDNLLWGAHRMHSEDIRINRKTPDESDFIKNPILDY